MIVVTATGPLFEGALDVRRGQRLGMERATARAGDLARGQLRARSRYSTPKYGRAHDSVRTRIEQVRGAGDQAIGSAYIGGQAAYLAPWLEHGTTAHFIAPKGRRRGRGRAAARAIAFQASGGILFRAYAHHPGTRAYRWASQAQAELNREAPGIFDAAMAEALKA